MQQTVIAIDLGGTKCAGALVDGQGKILESDKKFLGSLAGEEVGSLIIDLCFELEEKARKNSLQIKGIGISVPGISSQKTGKVWAPNIEGWSAFPLKKTIETTFPEKIPVLIDNDRACCILGETWMGIAKGSKNAIFLTVGTGIGAGILADGTILRGADDIAGAIGWMALESDYLTKYKDFGCFEYHASGDGLVREANDLLSMEQNKKPSKLKYNDSTARDILEAYANNDPIAQKVIRKAIRLWGKASANLISLFNPEIIVFGGGIFGPAQFLVGSIREEAARWAQPVSMKKVKMASSILGDKAPLMGAAKLILDLNASIQ